MPVDLLKYMIWHNTCGKGGYETKTAGPSAVVSVSNAAAGPAISVLVDLSAAQEGVGTPSPGNIRNISGWTGVSLLRYVDNQFDINWAAAADVPSTSVEVISRSRTVEVIGKNAYASFRSKNFSVESGDVYTLSGHIKYMSEIGATKPALGFRGQNSGDFIAASLVQLPDGVTEGDVTVTYTFTEDATVNVGGLIVGDTALEDYVTVDFSDIVLEKGTGVAARYSNTFPNPPGTVYGGTLDVVSGVLTVTHTIVDLGSLTYTKTTYSGITRFQSDDIKTVIKTPSASADKADVVCSQYKVEVITNITSSSDAKYDNSVGVASSVGTYPGRLYVRDSSKAELTKDEFKTAMNGVQLVYPLKTIETYQLTAQAVELFKGTNNLCSTAGNVTLTYTGKK